MRDPNVDTARKIIGLPPLPDAEPVVAPAPEPPKERNWETVMQLGILCVALGSGIGLGWSGTGIALEQGYAVDSWEVVLFVCIVGLGLVGIGAVMMRWAGRHL